MPSLCPNCQRKATPRGGWCVACADERRRRYNTAWVRASRNAQPREDRLEQRIVAHFKAMGWETAEWRRERKEKAS